MATLTIAKTRVALIKPILVMTAPSSEAFERGQYVRLSATGTWELGNASSAGEVGWGGIALTDGPVGAAVTVLLRGLLDIGAALSSMSYGAAVYLSDTDGTLADAAGTVSKIVGYVVPGWGNTTADKLLSVQSQ